jgi:hypothetical protein
VDYSHIETDADAILSVYYGSVGYMSPFLDNDYSPVMVIAAKLLDAKARGTLYARQYAIHPQAEKNRNDNIEAMLPDAAIRFASFDALMEHFDESAQGLLREQERIVARIARDLGAGEPSAEGKQ